MSQVVCFVSSEMSKCRVLKLLLAHPMKVLLFGAAVLRLDWPKLAEEVRERTLRERQEALGNNIRHDNHSKKHNATQY